MKIQSGNFTFDSGAYPQLADPNPPGDRTAQDFINFPTPFTGVPTVMVALSRLDVGNGANTRVTTFTDTINNDGFGAVLKTWWDTTLYSAGVSWIAYEN